MWNVVYPFIVSLEWCPDIIEHQVLACGLAAVTSQAGVTLPAPLLDITLCLKPVVLLSDLFQCIVDTQMSSLWPSVEFVHYIFHFAPGKELELSWTVCQLTIIGVP
jgi:hypothetical protein